MYSVNQRLCPVAIRCSTSTSVLSFRFQSRNQETVWLSRKAKKDVIQGKDRWEGWRDSPPEATCFKVTPSPQL